MPASTSRWCRWAPRCWPAPARSWRRCCAVQRSDRTSPQYARRGARARRAAGRRVALPRFAGPAGCCGRAASCWSPGSPACCCRPSPCSWSPTRPGVRRRAGLACRHDRRGAAGASPGCRSGCSARAPSRLLAWLDCPRRYRMQYLDRPPPPTRPQRAHTSVGVAVHNALRDWWDLPTGQRTAGRRARSWCAASWIDDGFRDPEQSLRWRSRAREGRRATSRGVDPRRPAARHRAHASRSRPPAWPLSGPRRPARRARRASSSSSTTRPAAGAPTDDDARTSLPLALYAVAAGPHVPPPLPRGSSCTTCPRARWRPMSTPTSRSSARSPRPSPSPRDAAPGRARTTPSSASSPSRFPAPGEPAVPVVRLPRALPRRAGRQGRRSRAGPALDGETP